MDGNSERSVTLSDDFWRHGQLITPYFFNKVMAHLMVAFNSGDTVLHECLKRARFFLFL